MNSALHLRLRARAAEQAARRRKEDRLSIFLHLKRMRDDLGLGAGGRNMPWDDFGLIIKAARAWSGVASFFAVQIAHSADVTNKFHVAMAMTLAQFEELYPELVDRAVAQQHVPVLQTWITNHRDPLLEGSGDAVAFKRTPFMAGAVGSLDVQCPL